MASAEGVIGIIGGSGLYELEGLEDVRWVEVKTPFGEPSDAYSGGPARRRDGGVPAAATGAVIGCSPVRAQLPRQHLRPASASARAAVISVSAVGSMKEEIHPLDLVLPDQFYDHTRVASHPSSEMASSAHVGMADPVCADLGDLLEAAGRESGARVHRGGTYLCIEGPQFSTKGESEIYRQWGVSVIGMTNMPEAKLAREAELCYATLALATDYDVWHEEHDAVTVEAVVAEPAEERRHRQERARARRAAHRRAVRGRAAGTRSGARSSPTRRPSRRRPAGARPCSSTGTSPDPGGGRARG